MADQQNIPEDDRDLQLAREIEAKLDSGLPLSEIEDPLVTLLLDYKQKIGRRSEDYTPDTAAIWSRIEEKTRPQPGKNRDTARVHPMRAADRRKIWAVAASILIIVLAGYFYFQEALQPTLIAESQQVQKTVPLEDGSRITLRPFSKIYLVERENGNVHYKLSGEGYFNVSSDPNRTFSVTAGTGRIRVLGTRFVLSSWGNLVQVFLEQGSVRFETTDRSQSTVLEPGYYATITEEQQIMEPRPADINQFTDWMNDELSFSNREAGYVFSELEQHFNIEINAPEEISNTRIGGTLSLARLDSSLNDLGVVLGGTFNTADERTYSFVPAEQ